MISKVMKHINNYFETDNFYIGEITITDNVISPSVDLLDGQYFRIVGSILNDGVYIKGDKLKNETFSGKIVGLAVPSEFISLTEEIKNYKPVKSQYQSESFGGYSYNLKDDASWETAFKNDLNDYRKI